MVKCSPSHKGILGEAIHTKILKKNHPDSPHSYLVFPYSHPDSLHSHPDSQHTHPIPGIPYLILCIPTPISRIPTPIPWITTLILRISCIPSCLSPQIHVPVLPSRMKMMALPSQTFSP